MSKNVFDDLRNKVVVVTGGTRGIGFATVKAFLQQGSKVVMLGSRKETVDKALHELSEYKDTIMGRYIDLNDLSACIDLLKEVLQEWGSVDVLINNAGVSDSKHFYSYEDADFDRVMNINLRSVFLMSKAAAEVMKKQPQLYPNTYAPSTDKTAPLIYDAISLAKNRNAFAISSGSPKRCTGTPFAIAEIIFGSSAFTISVAMIPGATAFTRIPSFPSSLANDLVIPLTANLLVG